MGRLAQTVWFPFVALCLSNIFMTFAWYRHLKFKDTQPLWIAIAASCGIAFFEYLIDRKSVV